MISATILTYIEYVMRVWWFLILFWLTSNIWWEFDDFCYYFDLHRICDESLMISNTILTYIEYVMRVWWFLILFWLTSNMWWEFDDFCYYFDLHRICDESLMISNTILTYIEYVMRVWWFLILFWLTSNIWWECLTSSATILMTSLRSSARSIVSTSYSMPPFALCKIFGPKSVDKLWMSILLPGICDKKESLYKLGNNIVREKLWH